MALIVTAAILSRLRQKIKTLPDLPRDLFLGGLVCAVGITGYALGGIAARQEAQAHALRVSVAPILLPHKEMAAGVEAAGKGMAVLGAYVGSRSGTAFHLPTCPGALKIKPENRVWFATKEAAIARGYHPAGNCPGL